MNGRLVVREATAGDAAAVALLVCELGFPSSEAEVAQRLAELDPARDGLLVADSGRVVGCLSWTVTRTVHRPRPVGRITMLVVESTTRGTGAGRALVEAAERRLQALGCGLVEVTSNLVRTEAHAFYVHLGYERTSYRFARLIA